jgi:hypothetical protein
MKISVYVQSIKNTGNGIVVEATNGGAKVPPFVRWKVNEIEAQEITIGTRFTFEIHKGY